MSELENAARQALEALELTWHSGMPHPNIMQVGAAITALRCALEQQAQQEPIYQMQMMDGKWIDQAKHSYEYNKAHGHTVRILYTRPQAREPLTDEEIEALLVNWPEDGIAFFDFARAIEAAHGIGEKK